MMYSVYGSLCTKIFVDICKRRPDQKQQKASGVTRMLLSPLRQRAPVHQFKAQWIWPINNAVVLALHVLAHWKQELTPCHISPSVPLAIYFSKPISAKWGNATPRLQQFNNIFEVVRMFFNSLQLTHTFIEITW